MKSLKKVVKRLWDESRMEDEVCIGLRKLGVGIIEGKMGRLLFRSLGLVQDIIGEDFAESDEFGDEFMYSDDFDEFWKKWFEERKN